MKKLLFIAIIAVLGCTALQAKNRIRIKRESWEVKASTRVYLCHGMGQGFHQVDGG